jgi:anti-sigma B factor antagonist
MFARLRPRADQAESPRTSAAVLQPRPFGEHGRCRDVEDEGPEVVITPTHAAETIVLALAGDLDIASAPLLERHLDDAATIGSVRVVVDLSDVEFLDSTGLRVLLTARERLQERGQELRLRPGPPVVQRLFELTQTAGLFQFEE